MNYVNIGIILLVLICMIFGYKNGVIKTTVNLFLLLAILMISFVLSEYLSDFLIKHLNFFNFGGKLENLYAFNVLFYRALSFLFIFLILYSLITLITGVAGIFDKLLRSTIIFNFPDRILGAIVGFLQGLLFSFLIIVVLIQLPFTHEYVLKNNMSLALLNRTPVIRVVFAKATNTTEDIFKVISKKADSKEKNIEMMNIFIKYRIITAKQAQYLVDNKKLGLELVQFR